LKKNLQNIPFWGPFAALSGDVENAAPEVEEAIHRLVKRG
jgi:hypothetical protein